MKSFLSHRSRRFGYDGWALRFKGTTIPLWWTVSTTRREVRQLKKERSDLFDDDVRIVKVTISVAEVKGVD